MLLVCPGASRRDSRKRKRHGGGSQAVDLPQQRDDASGASTSASNQVCVLNQQKCDLGRRHEYCAPDCAL